MPFSNKPGSLGFFVTFILEWVSGYVLMCIFSSVNSFYFGISWMIDTCISDSFRFFRQMDAIISNAAHHQEPQLEVKKLLIEFIRLHNDIMRWANIQRRRYCCCCLSSSNFPIFLLVFWTILPNSWATPYFSHSSLACCGCARHYSKYKLYVDAVLLIAMQEKRKEKAECFLNFF